MASTEHVPSFAHLEYDTPLYRTAVAQFDQAVPYADVDQGVAERLATLSARSWSPAR